MSMRDRIFSLFSIPSIVVALWGSFVGVNSLLKLDLLHFGVVLLGINSFLKLDLGLVLGVVVYYLVNNLVSGSVLDLIFEPQPSAMFVHELFSLMLRAKMI